VLKSSWKMQLLKVDVSRTQSTPSKNRNQMIGQDKNIANKALQQQFNKYVFKLEHQKYEKEGSLLKFISFPDNQDVLDLIDMKFTGVYTILDEQCILPQSSMKSLLATFTLAATSILVTMLLLRSMSTMCSALKTMLATFEALSKEFCSEIGLCLKDNADNAVSEDDNILSY
jgi:hypothetical protein